MIRRPPHTIEGYHRQVSKITKTKGSFTSETLLLKLVYLVQLKISQKLPSPIWAGSEAQTL